MIVTKKKVKKNYVDNKKLFTVLLQYRLACKESVDNATKAPKIPDYVGECILAIAKRLATRPNFASYPFVEEMIGDGYENCIAYLHNFNPDKSDNPFAYFTQIIWYAFIRRIKKEKKQLYVKHKALHNSYVFGMMEAGEDHDTHQTVDLDNAYMSDLVTEFEAKLAEKKKKKKEGLEKFAQTDENT